MKKKTSLTVWGFAAVASALLVYPSFSQTVDRQAALDSLVAAEKAFSDDAAKKGIRDSFLDFLADDSVVFTPDPVNGRETLRSGPAQAGLLSWYPVYSEVSLAGDLGYNTGPYEFRAKAGDKPAATGQFSTVWRRQADGSWKAVVDLGTPGNPPAAGTISLQGPAKVAASALPKVDAGAAKASLLEADRRLAGAAQESGTAALVPVLTDDVRLLRAGQAMTSGKAAAQTLLAEDKAPVTWEPAGGGVARSGDLGYTYGILERRDIGVETPWMKTGNYLRVWRKQLDGSWKLAFDVLSPRPKLTKAAPAEEKKPGGE
ncbi:MAG TPA: nuclear transport factor 2 family protein [Thermoanaerobaculia bacterium]